MKPVGYKQRFRTWRPWNSKNYIDALLVKYRPYAEAARDEWNASADKYNQWEDLGLDEREDLIEAQMRKGVE